MESRTALRNRLACITLALIFAMSALNLQSATIRAESWTDDFSDTSLNARWVKGGVGDVMVREGSGTVYAYSYTGEYQENWHGPHIRATLPAFSDFNVSATFQCISQELQINRLMVRILDQSGTQLFAFGWSDFLSVDSKAEIGLYGTSDSTAIFKTDSSYAYANFFDKDVRLARSGQTLNFYIEDVQVYTGSTSQATASQVEIVFLKLLEECTNEVLDVSRISVSATDADVPGPPESLAGSAGNRFVALAWSPPSDSGTLPITSYRVYRGTAVGTEAYLTTVSGATALNDTGLVNGQEYFYRVSAVNEIGEGALCTAISSTPVTVPAYPASLVGIAGDGLVLLSWNLPSTDGGSPVTGYRLYRSADQTPQFLASLGTVTSRNDTGLTNSMAYHYWISAVNSVGEGPLSPEIIAIPGSVATVPTAPRNLTAVPSDGAVHLAWLAPTSSGNMPILGYRVYIGTVSGSMALEDTVTGSLSYVSEGLTNGLNYYYRVNAFNYLGESPASNEAEATPLSPSMPSAPMNFTLAPGNHSVTLAWNAPYADGGSDIVGYRVYRGNQSGAERLIVELGIVYSFSDTGLINNKTYYYRLTAFNALGEGAYANGSAKTPSTATNNILPPGDPEELPDWTDNFTLTSGIATVIAMVVGLAIAYFFMRGDGTQPTNSGKAPDQRIDDKPEDDGADKEEEHEKGGDLLPESRD